LEQDLEKAKSYGIQATPTIFINGTNHEGLLPFSEYQLAIESELAK
jgi:protein-disulfide isomerase